MAKLVDLTHLWDWHTPPWSGYPSSKIYYIQRMADGGVVSQYIETSLHMGTHMDGQMHIVPNGADIASIPLDTLYGDGVIVDISDKAGMFDIIKPEHFEGKVEIRKGDIPHLPHRLAPLLLYIYPGKRNGRREIYVHASGWIR